MSPLLVSEAGKGVGCCGMSAGRGDGIGKGVCARGAFTEEEDGGVGEWC